MFLENILFPYSELRLRFSSILTAAAAAAAVYPAHFGLSPRTYWKNKNADAAGLQGDLGLTARVVLILNIN